MELGNLIFGNSRGEYPIDRDAFSGVKAWWELLGRIHPDGPKGCGGYGSEFDNEVFEMHPYWWGDCTCGRDERSDAYYEGKGHGPGCVNHRIYAKHKELGGYSTKREKVFKAFLEEIGVPYQGCMVACDCGYNEESNAWEQANPHAADCKIDRPNFIHKPTGYSVSWYKYPFRDAYQSQELDVAGFAAIVNDCLASLAAAR